MVELPQVFDVSLVLLLHLLDSEDLLLVGSHEHRALSPGAEPLEVPDFLEWNLPALI